MKVFSMAGFAALIAASTLVGVSALEAGHHGGGCGGGYGGGYYGGTCGGGYAGCGGWSSSGSSGWGHGGCGPSYGGYSSCATPVRYGYGGCGSSSYGGCGTSGWYSCGGHAVHTVFPGGGNGGHPTSGDGYVIRSARPVKVSQTHVVSVATPEKSTRVNQITPVSLTSRATELRWY